MIRLATLAARWLLLASLSAVACAQQGAYLLEISGAVEARFEGAAADVQGVEYTTLGGSASNSSGPYKIVLPVPDAQVQGAAGASSVTLTIDGPVPPGEYPIGVESGGETVAGFAHADVDGERLDDARARFRIEPDRPGTLLLERFDREAITGTFEFEAANRADPPETIVVRGSFTNLEYNYDSEIDVVASGSFSSDPVVFGDAVARRADDALRITLLQTTGPDLVFTLPTAQSGRVELGPDAPGGVTFDGEPGTGAIELLRLGTDTVGGSFEVEVPIDGRTGTLDGEFDYVPLVLD